MENKKDVLWEEYKILQDKIDKYGDSSIKFKGFAITVTLAVALFAIKESSALIAAMGMIAMLSFLYYEAVNKIHYDTLKKRAYDVEKAILNPYRGERTKTPFIAISLKEKNTVSIIKAYKSVAKNWQLFLLYHLFILSFFAIFVASFFSSKTNFMTCPYTPHHIHKVNQNDK